jgi:hypothetical protein
VELIAAVAFPAGRHLLPFALFVACLRPLYGPLPVDTPAVAVSQYGSCTAGTNRLIPDP